MIIQVLGTGCTKCKTLYELANKAVDETGVEALVEKSRTSRRSWPSTSS